MEIKEGNTVKVIDEDLEGTVVMVEEDWVYFECVNGFEYKYLKEQLIYFDNLNNVYHKLKMIEIQETTSIHKDLIKQAKNKVSLIGKKPIIDLHIEELLTDSEYLRNNQVLTFQLSHAKEVIQKASDARIRRLVFVHGRGSGVLRDSLRQMLDDSFPNIEYFDADYQKFGGGATEIQIHGLGKRGKS